MANHSASEKAIRKTIKRSAVNRNRRTRVRTYVKKVLSAVDADASSEFVASTFISAQVEMMRAVSKGLIKKNTASRKISRLAKKVKALMGNRGESLPKIERKSKTEKKLVTTDKTSTKKIEKEEQ